LHDLNTWDEGRRGGNSISHSLLYAKKGVLIFEFLHVKIKATKRQKKPREKRGKQRVEDTSLSFERSRMGKKGNV
jgi:hypothetical protein